MRGELVALDLETTGLDVSKDAIIEIGAVKLQEGEIVAEYSTMIDPKTDIPPTVTSITGIRQEDVVGAPLIAAALPEIAQFVGDCPVIAHNISLDMGFLRDRHGILANNQELDTYEIAGILLPNAPRYNLNSLTVQLGIVLDHAHRALDDARATALLYWELWQITKQLPRKLLEEIAEYGSSVDWHLRSFFAAAVQESDNLTSPDSWFSNVIIKETTQHVKPASIKSVADVFDDGGSLSGVIPNYEGRPQQLEMAKRIENALANETHLIIEAGTGTGKTLAYLVAGAIHALQNEERVVIATNTIQLQDQILHADVPLLQKALDTQITAALLKGRSNYLCPRQFEALRNRQPSDVAELQVLAKLLVWLQDETTGDLADINLRGSGEYEIWNRLSAAADTCSETACEGMMQGICPFHNARKQAESSNLVIVNHALLVADALTENNVIPPYQTLIIDEGHRFEGAITSSLTRTLNRRTFQYRLNELGNAHKGVLGQFLRQVRAVASKDDVQKYEGFIADVYDVARSMQVHVDNFFIAVNTVRQEAVGGGDHSPFARINDEVRQHSAFSQVHKRWEILNEFLAVLVKALKKLNKFINKFDGHADNSNLQQLTSDVTVLINFFATRQADLAAFVSDVDVNDIHWLSTGFSDDGIQINTAPLTVGPYVEKLLWNAKKSVILTGATLRTNENFKHIKRRLYAEDIKTTSVGSPFDYRKAAMIYVPNDVPEPNDYRGYQRALEHAVIDLATALNGRILVLFTSYNQLRETSQAVSPRLALGNIEVFDQSDGTGRNMLLEGFKTTEKAVLMGTRSFWEGIDIPGDDLSGLIITRLPFPVPSDPIFSARSETYDDPFNQYALPEAIVRFRQGFGRLIRSQTDRGIAVIMDSRIVSRRYGAEFLQALPDCTMRDGPLDNLAMTAKSWLFPAD